MGVFATAAGCAPSLGTLSGPGWREPVRTAWYATDVVDGAPHAVVLLSNSALPCATPDAFGDPDALTSFLVAACREDARHVLLELYDRDGTWAEVYPGVTDADAADLDARPRVAGARYYAVLEAVLVAGGGLDRRYLATAEERADLGDGGSVTLADGFRGEFGFPEGLQGEFAAERCADPSVLQVARNDLGYYCSHSFFDR